MCLLRVAIREWLLVFFTCGGKMELSLLLFNVLTLRLCASFIICELKMLSYTGGISVSCGRCYLRCYSTRYVSVALFQVRCAEYLLRPSSGSPKPSGTNKLDFYFWRMPEHDAAIKLNLAQSRQEVTPRDNNMTSGSFFKLQHSVLTPAHKSQKRDKHKLFY